MSDVKNRLRDYLKFKRISQKEFAKSAGLSSAFVNSIRVSIQPKTLDKISQVFTDLNIGWLLTGEGKMLKTDTDNITTGDVSGSDNSIGSSVSQHIGEVSGQNTGRDILNAASCDNGKWLAELEHQRKLTEKAHSIAETAQIQLSTALAQLSELIKQNKEQLSCFTTLLNLKQQSNG